MADLSFDGGGGGGGYYPPSFDPNNPMGTSGGGSNTYIPQTSEGNYYSLTKQYADPSLTSEWFEDNFNTKNPYQKSYIYYSISNVSNYWEYITRSGNTYTLQGSSLGNRYYDITVYNNAYTDFENKATSAQNIYLSQQQAEFDKANSKYAADLTASYGNVRDSSIQNSIQQFADLKSQINALQYQDDITSFLNRVGDTDNSKQIAELEKQAAVLDAELSKKLLEYWQQQELIRKQSREFFTYDFKYLSDPYFGRDGGEMYPRFIADSAQQDTNNFFDLNSSGDIGDWMAGGSMYDSPRAGDILFNPMGNLNTTVFLGLENKNFAFDMTASYTNAEVFKTFGALAGDSRFSVLNFGS